MESEMAKPKKTVAKKAATAAPAKPIAKSKSGSKLHQLEALLRRPEGATLEQMSKALDWQAHSIRGAMSGTLKKRQGLTILASKEEGVARIYRIVG
jgi:Protein of unknown function (DUF3489)